MSSPSQTEEWRERLRQARGPVYWQSLEEIAASAEFMERARQDFPGFAAVGLLSPDRRRFLQLAAASMALMGLAACGPEVEPRNREPYIQQPPHIIPGGRPSYYATATTLQGYGTGVLIEHRMGRPLKVEGNPEHPASLGATSAIGQATILGLYDPYRAQSLTHQGRIDTWEALATAVLSRTSSLRARKGAGLAVLTGSLTSPTLVNQINSLRSTFPGLSWYEWESVNRDQVRAGALRDLRAGPRLGTGLRRGGHHCGSRERLPRMDSGAPALRAPVRLAAPRRRGSFPDESTLCAREHANAGRREGGSSAYG